MNKLPLIICVGNPSRGDDAAGPLVAEALRVAAPILSIIETFQLQPELVDDMTAHATVVIIDAQANAQHPITLRKIAAARDIGWCSHALSPEQLLGLFEIAHAEPPPRVIAVGIQACQFALGDTPLPITCELSGNVAQALLCLSERIHSGDLPDVYNFLADSLNVHARPLATTAVQPLASESTRHA